MIVPLDNQTTRVPTVLPKIPFSSYIVASKKSGKTTLLLNLLRQEEYLKAKFNRIFWVSPTSSFDQKVMDLKDVDGLCSKNLELEKLEKRLKKTKKIMEEVKIKKNNDTLVFMEELELDFLLHMMDEQKKIITTYGKKYADDILLILDDSIEAKILKHKKFKDFLFKSRHYKISVIFISQSYFSLPKALRLNNRQVILFETGNLK